MITTKLRVKEIVSLVAKSLSTIQIQMMDPENRSMLCQSHRQLKEP